MKIYSCSTRFYFFLIFNISIFLGSNSNLYHQVITSDYFWSKLFQFNSYCDGRSEVSYKKCYKGFCLTKNICFYNVLSLALTSKSVYQTFKNCESIYFKVTNFKSDDLFTLVLRFFETNKKMPLSVFNNFTKCFFQKCKSLANMFDVCNYNNRYICPFFDGMFFSENVKIMLRRSLDSELKLLEDLTLCNFHTILNSSRDSSLGPLSGQVDLCDNNLCFKAVALNVLGTLNTSFVFYFKSNHEIVENFKKLISNANEEFFTNQLLNNSDYSVFKNEINRITDEFLKTEELEVNQICKLLYDVGNLFYKEEFPEEQETLKASGKGIECEKNLLCLYIKLCLKKKKFNLSSKEYLNNLKIIFIDNYLDTVKLFFEQKYSFYGEDFSDLFTYLKRLPDGNNYNNKLEKIILTIFSCQTLDSFFKFFSLFDLSWKDDLIDSCLKDASCISKSNFFKNIACHCAEKFLCQNFKNKFSHTELKQLSDLSVNGLIFCIKTLKKLQKKNNKILSLKSIKIRLISRIDCLMDYLNKAKSDLIKSVEIQENKQLEINELTLEVSNLQKQIARLNKMFEETKKDSIIQENDFKKKRLCDTNNKLTDKDVNISKQKETIKISKQEETIKISKQEERIKQLQNKTVMQDKKIRYLKLLCGVLISSLIVVSAFLYNFVFLKKISV